MNKRRIIGLPVWCNELHTFGRKDVSYTIRSFVTRAPNRSSGSVMSRFLQWNHDYTLPTVPVMNVCTLTNYIPGAINLCNVTGFVCR